MRNKQDKIRLYFLGSGKIAVPILQKIADSTSIDLVGVGTQLDQPSGRKKRLHPTPVGAWGDTCGVAVDKIDSVNKLNFIEKMEELSPDFILVVSFGQLLKEKILSLPKSGCINVHASLLPKYRGASPIIASILSGDRETGIAVMEMEKGLDSGPVFASFKHKLNDTENAEELEMILGELAADSIADTLIKIFEGELTAQLQDHSLATHVGKVKKQDGEFDWKFPAAKIERMVRAYYPWPGAYFYLNLENKRKKIQITEAVVCENENSADAGQIIKADKSGWVIACGTDALEIKKLIPEGKKEMTGADFIRGCRSSMLDARC